MATHRQHQSYSFTSPVSEKDALVMVTGADSSHYISLVQFLSSLFTHEPFIKAIAFDLGLIKRERQYLENAFPSLEVRRFDYSKYPGYFDIKINAGEYAWKPVILFDILNEFKCGVCWMDAGNIVTEPLAAIRKIIAKAGMYSPLSSGQISDWTHPKTLEFLDTSDDLLDKTNLNGACVAVSYHCSTARDLVDQWKKCALIRECIAPIGSSRNNHRQDQAVLSVLAHQSGIVDNMPTGYYGFKIHQDVD